MEESSEFGRKVSVLEKKDPLELGRKKVEDFLLVIKVGKGSLEFVFEERRF